METKNLIQTEHIYDQINFWKEDLVEKLMVILDDFSNKSIELDNNFSGIVRIYLADDENGYEELYIDDLTTYAICVSNPEYNNLFDLLTLADLVNDYIRKH